MDDPFEKPIELPDWMKGGIVAGVTGIVTLGVGAFVRWWVDKAEEEGWIKWKE